jgi:hypothetical protein
MDAQGFYNGQTNKDQNVVAVVLDDGSFYALYEDPGISEFNGVIIGNVEASGGTLSSSNVINYDLTKTETHKMTISATYAPKDWLNGALAYPGENGNNINFTTKYDAEYEKTPTLAAIAGTYSGLVKGLSMSAPNTRLSIETDGIIAFDSGMCKAKGTIAPRTSGNVYSLALNFDETTSSCVYSGQTLSGIAAVVDGTVTMVAHNADTSNPLLFNGDKVAEPAG